ncbi:hypothetical protein HanIR_Chr05g0224411 [Helianthus annuus]|nr:hypothetical protein HanIR_Chr05g0224411 [Helianthus annuus]
MPFLCVSHPHSLSLFLSHFRRHAPPLQTLSFTTKATPEDSTPEDPPTTDSPATGSFEDRLSQNTVKTQFMTQFLPSLRFDV